MNKPHKHAEIIKQWADGTPVQFKNHLDEWKDTNQPAWDECVKYRVKPEIVKYRLYLWKGKCTGVYTLNFHEGYNPEHREGFVRWLGDWQEVEM